MTVINRMNANTATVAKTSLYKAQGLSLVELLIAMALSAFLLFGVMQIFLTNKQTSGYQNSFGEIQESGRIGSELIVRDLRLAGHWGCAPSLADITSQLNYDPDGDDNDAAPKGPGDDRTGLDIEHDVLAGVEVGGVDVKPGTDIITIRGARALSNIRIQDPMANPTSPISINSVEISAGSVLLISDCQQGDIFTVAGPIVDGEVNHTADVVAANIPNTSASLSKAYDEKAQLLRLFTRQYFVGVNADGRHSLYLKENTRAPDEVVRNIEDLEFSLSEDTSGDGSANQFNLKAGSVSNMNQVVSVKIDIHTESTNQSVTEGKSLTRVYSMTANLRNRSL